MNEIRGVRAVTPLAIGSLWCHKPSSSLLKPQSLHKAGLGAVGQELSPRGWEQGLLIAQSWSASPLRQPSSSNIPLGEGADGGGGCVFIDFPKAGLLGQAWTPGIM